MFSFCESPSMHFQLTEQMTTGITRSTIRCPFTGCLSPVYIMSVPLIYHVISFGIYYTYKIYTAKAPTVNVVIEHNDWAFVSMCKDEISAGLSIGVSSPILQHLLLLLHEMFLFHAGGDHSEE